MCGRFVAVSSPQLLVARFGVDESTVGGHQPDYNVTPRAMVPIVRERRRRDQLINARAESVAEKAAFKRAFRRRRCIVPADAFYEWKPARAGASSRRPPRQPFLIHRSDGQPLAFAGLWEIWRDPAVSGDDEPEAWLRTCTIVTTRANPSLAPIHDRMPVVLDEDAWDPWLDPANADVGQLEALLQPAPDDWFDVYPVSARVNAPANNDPELLERVAPDTLL
jgi:putative SOS response-associated peptidase YedK